MGYIYDPEVAKLDLEGHFAKIAPALRHLREEEPLTRDEQREVIALLDMHLERGRYADQAEVRTPALVVRANGTSEHSELELGDRLLLSRSVKNAVRLYSLGLEHWPWRLYKVANLITRDGAVVLWRDSKGSGPSKVTFPISPTLMLVIGSEIDSSPPIHDVVAENSRLWLVGGIGTLTQDPARIAAARNPAGSSRTPVTRSLGADAGAGRAGRSAGDTLPLAFERGRMPTLG